MKSNLSNDFRLASMKVKVRFILCVLSELVFGGIGLILAIRFALEAKDGYLNAIYIILICFCMAIVYAASKIPLEN